jgi:hypothetical protein
LLPATDLSAVGQYGAQPEVALDPGGNAIAVWRRSNGTNEIVQAAVRLAGGAWQPAQDLSAIGADAFNPRVAVDAAGNALAVWERAGTVQAAARPAGGTWQAPQDIGASTDRPDVALDPAGNAVAVWAGHDGTNRVIRAAVRPAGAAWQPAQDLSAPGQNALGPGVAIDGGGNAVAVWRRAGFIQAAVRPAGGPWQLPAQDLSASGADQPQVAVDPAGNAVAVWRRADIVQAAVRPAGGPWQAAQDLSGSDVFDPQVALDPAGNAVAVWERFNGANNVIQAAVRPAGSAWQAAQDISLAGQTAFDPQVALDAAGNAVAVWPRAGIVQAAVRPSGGAWQPALDLSAVGQTANNPQVAVDPAGNAVAVWHRYNGMHDIIQGAGYDGAGPLLRTVTTPARGFARQRLTFSLDAFDAWSALAAPVWNFGDGKIASGQTVTHTFARGGTYTVGVTQPDAVGNSSSTTRLLTLRVARCFGKAATRVGTSGPDRIRGTRRADVIVTLGGADRVRGRGGNDRICGGKGRDRLAGGAGNDLLNGGPGRDICSQGGGRGRLVAC